MDMDQFDQPLKIISNNISVDNSFKYIFLLLILRLIFLVKSNNSNLICQVIIF